MKSITNLLLISGLLVLAGCATPSVEPRTVVVSEYVYADCGTPPERDKVYLRALSWEVIDGRFTLSATAYENLSYNTSEILKALKQLKVIVEYYEQCLQEQKKSSQP